MPLNEADTRTHLISPQLIIAGWKRSQTIRKQYYRLNWST